MEQPSELFEYTTGQWLWNNASKHLERRRVFDLSEFKRLAAAAVNQTVEDVASLEKLAEGGFNRSFLVTMQDGFKFIGRIPYPVTEPKRLVVASEVATIDFLRSHGMPVPKIYSYSANSDNPAGTEYIFMELIRGTNLGDVWFELSAQARNTVVENLVKLESQLFQILIPANGSIYYTKDLPAKFSRVEFPNSDATPDNRFCIGPETRLDLWHGKRLDVCTDRGPYTDAIAVLSAGAKKEISYLKQFGRPLLPFQRLRREIYDYKKLSPSEHVENLKNYLQIAPYIVPHGSENLGRPVIRHPDLQPNNIFVSDDLSIAGLIDWQHCSILPLFLQCGIPNTFQNYGDDVSESLIVPKLPENLDKMDDHEQFEQVLLFRKRQLHYVYVAATEQLNPIHYEALSHHFSVLRRKLFDHSGFPWEGDNVTLKFDLIELATKWSSVTSSGTNTPECPITFSEEEAKETLRLNAAQIEADDQLQSCRDVVGIGPEGWAPLESHAETKQRADQLKVDALKAAESEEERRILNEHWVFGDFDEGEYS